MEREDFSGPDAGYLVVTWDDEAMKWRYRPVLGGTVLSDGDVAALGLQTPPEPGPGMRQPVAFSQIDPRWKSAKLGSSGQTIGGWGCAMVCACMVYSQVQPGITPLEFDNILTRHQGYNYLNGEAHLAWDRLPMIFPELVWKGRADYSRRLTDAELEAIYGRIERQPLVLWVDFKPVTAKLDTHFVLGIARADDDITVIDPYGGETVGLLQRYALAGQDLKRALWGYRELVVRRD